MAGEMERADMRASDLDRTMVAQRLQRAVDEGRLDVAEYDERLQQVYVATTYGELAKVTADLPTTDAAAVPGGQEIGPRRPLSDGRRRWIAAVVVIGIGLILASRFAAVVPVVFLSSFVVFAIVFGRSTDEPFQRDP